MTDEPKKSPEESGNFFADKLSKILEQRQNDPTPEEKSESGQDEVGDTIEENIRKSAENTADRSMSQKVNVPSLNLPGADKAANRRMTTAQLMHMKTENELELERQRSQVVTGPLDKKWENFGVPMANDDNQLINPDR